ncbi:MAG: hypothetical protein ACI8S6_002757 [Myxococcota bacterium]|jgi:hypothetical protein
MSPEQTLQILSSGEPGWKAVARLSEQLGGPAAAAALQALIHTSLLPEHCEEAAWRQIASHGEPTAGDVLALLGSIQHEGLLEKGWLCWGMVDWLESLCALVRDTDTAALIAGQGTLSPLCRQMLAFALAAAGHQTPDVAGIPIEVLAAWATDNNGRGWVYPVFPVVLGGRRWAEAVTEVLRSKDSIHTFGPLYPILPHLSSDEVVDLVEVLQRDPRKTIALLTTAGPRILPELLRRLDAATPITEEYPGQEASQRQERDYIRLAIARRLGGDIRRFAPLIEGMVLRCCYPHRSLGEVASALPLEERSRLTLAAPILQWSMVAVTPTPQVLQAAIEAITALPRTPMSTDIDQLSSAFHVLGTAARPALLAALPGKSSRLILLKLLRPQLDADALPTLVKMLSDSLPDVRELAAEMIGLLPPEVVRPVLLDALQKKKKKTRLGAARALALQPELVVTIREAVQARAQSAVHPDVQRELRAALRPAPVPAPLARLLAAIEQITPEQHPILAEALYSALERDWEMQINRHMAGHRAFGELLVVFAVEQTIWRTHRLLKDRGEWGLVHFHRHTDPELVAWAGVWLHRWSPIPSNAMPIGLGSTTIAAPVADAYRWLLTHYDPPGRQVLFESLVKGSVLAGAAYLRGLCSTDARTRRACQAGLRLEPGVHTAALISLLQHPTAGVRESVAPLLCGVDAAHEALSVALAKERNRKVQAALQAALG